MPPYSDSIPAALIAAVDRSPDAIALAGEGPSLTYAQLLDRCLRAGAQYRAHGVQPGDRVAIWLPNSYAWVEAALGALFVGAVLVPLNTRLRGQEAAYILRKSGARLLVAARGFLDTDYLSLLDGHDLPDLSTRLRVDFGPDAVDEWGPALASQPPERVAAVRQELPGPDDLAEIMFTSGTTGFPKGAMLRHGQILQAYRIYIDRAQIGADDRYLIIAPMFHSFGFKAGVLAAILAGATMYPVHSFDAAATLATIERERISVMGGPPAIFNALLELNARAQRDISSLRSIVTGASMVSPDLIRMLQQEVGVDVVVNAYGLTETCALVTMTQPDDDIETIATTAGRVIDGVEMRLVDDQGAMVATGEPGEIEARGFNITAGYFEDPEQTAAAFRPDGWFRTGDIGVVDTEGRLRVTDRAKDMFIVGGFNCYPAEIEAMILEHPAIRDVAVIGVPDDRLGEVAKAYVALKPGAAFDKAAFIAWCRENFANYKTPRYVEICDALPRNAMGKIQKFMLRENAAASE